MKPRVDAIRPTGCCCLSKLSALVALLVVSSSTFYYLVEKNWLPSTINSWPVNGSAMRQRLDPWRVRFDVLSNTPVVRFVNDKARAPMTCLIVVRTSDGAIGNRMFLFASAYGLARLHQCELYVAPWILTDLRSVFTVNLNDTPVHLISDASVLNSTELTARYSACTLFVDLLRIPLAKKLTHYEMIGFYQAYGYFVRYRDELSFLFQFNRDAISHIVAFVEQLCAGESLVGWPRDDTLSE
jgi:hypothetical protein